MADDAELDVAAAELVTATESSTEEQQPVVENETTIEEPVDESGVPLKNRLIEANRKLEAARRALANQAEKSILTPKVEEVTKTEQEEAIETVRRISREEAAKINEPILARQFLMEHPDAVNMVEAINEVRSLHPELAGVETAKTELETVAAKALQAASSGTRKIPAPAVTLDDQINSASSLAELAKLEASLK